MKYSVNTEKLGNSFVLPGEMVDKWLKLASFTQIKVLLCCFRNIAGGIDKTEIANRLNISENETADALAFWAQAGLLTEDGKTAEKEKKAVVIKTEMPTRQDVIRRSMEDENIKFLMRQAQVFFGRNLKQNESSYLVYLYDDCGMEAAVILYLISHAASLSKCNLSFIKECSARWLKEGVETVADAESIITRAATEDLAWKAVSSAFGIEKRKPSEKEKTLSNIWLNEWKISSELLKAAYDVCVDTKSRFSFSYVAAIIEAWHKKGIETLEDIKRESQKSNKKKSGNDYAGFDIEAFEKSLDED